MKEPKDLGVKFGTKREAMWTKVLKEAKMLKQQSEENLEIQNEMIKLSESIIKEEKGK